MAAAALEDDHEAWEYPYNVKYRGAMTSFMSYLHGRSHDPYPSDQTFTKAELLLIVPSQVRQWLNLKTYRDPFPPEGAIPEMRSGSVDKLKSAISFYMPNR